MRCPFRSLVEGLKGTLTQRKDFSEAKIIFKEHTMAMLKECCAGYFTHGSNKTCNIRRRRTLLACSLGGEHRTASWAGAGEELVTFHSHSGSREKTGSGSRQQNLKACPQGTISSYEVLFPRVPLPSQIAPLAEVQVFEPMSLWDNLTGEDSWSRGDQGQGLER